MSEQDVSDSFVERLAVPRMPHEDATKPFPELVVGLPVIHLALVNVAQGAYLYHQETTNEGHALWIKESYDQQAKNEEPGFVFYKGNLSPVEHIAAEQSRLAEQPAE